MAHVMAQPYADDTTPYMHPISSMDDSLRNMGSTQYRPESYEQENLHINTKEVLTEDPERIDQEGEEDLPGYKPDAPEYTDTTEDPEMSEHHEELHGWPTTRMARPIAEEYWNPEMNGLEDNDHSSTLHDQMTSEEVYEWLQEPSDQVVFDRYDRPNREDNRKRQRLLQMRLRENHWTGDLGPDF